MAAKLKLVHPVVSSARPIATGYYGAARDAEKDFEVMTHSKTVRGAARAAFTRLIDRRSVKAIIHDEGGVVVARIWRERGRIFAVGV